MSAAFQAVITFLSGLFGKGLADAAVRWVAIRALAITLMVTVLPVVLNNVFYALFDSILSVANTQYGSAASGLTSFRWQITGLAAYLAQHLKLIELVSMSISMVVIKFTLGLIPFVRV